MITYLKKMEDLVEGSSKRAGEELEQESTNKQKVDEDKDTGELQSLMEVIPDEEEVAVDSMPLTTKPPTIVDWKIHKEGKNSYFQIIRAYGSSKMYLVFSHMLKSFDKEDMETLYKLVKANSFIEDETCAPSYVGRKDISPYTVYYYRYTEQEASVTATLIDVTAAQSKLVLLENFNENYSKCLRLLEEVTTASGS
ncbi:hypothetical protein Tco_1466095 [Tanacetum coccineum]